MNKTYILSSVIGLALVSVGAAGTFAIMQWHQRGAPSAPDPIAENEAPPENEVTDQVPAELAGVAWALGDCSDRKSVVEFQNGQTVNFMGFPEAERRNVKYQKVEDGWRVIGTDKAKIYSRRGKDLQIQGVEIANEMLRGADPAILTSCAKLPFDKVVDVPPHVVKEPLRYALWMAIVMKDADAAERIITRMPNVEGGINGDGDPNADPNIDTMLATASRDIYLLIQKKRGRDTSGSPQDAYANKDVPWSTVPGFPVAMLGDYIVLNRVGGCSNPFMSVSTSSLTRNIFDKSYTNFPEKIAVSGNRVWLQNKPEKEGQSFGGGIVFEIQPDGSLTEVANLGPSGTPNPSDGARRYPRCPPMPSSGHVATANSSDPMANTNAAYSRSTEAVATAWRALPAGVRERVLPEQRAWIKQKMTDCRRLGAQAAGGADQKEAARLQCEVGLDKLRVQQLRAML